VRISTLSRPPHSNAIGPFPPFTSTLDKGGTESEDYASDIDRHGVFCRMHGGRPLVSERLAEQPSQKFWDLFDSFHVHGWETSGIEPIDCVRRACFL
jgi:hypothetical protein